MSETIKTMFFVAAAVVAVTAAWLLSASQDVVDVQKFIGQYLNADIDVDEPRRLEIVKFDRPTASIRRFEVSEMPDRPGVWSIPSKQGYPADATEQMAEAVTCLMDRKILRVAGETAQSHESLGVVDPLAEGLDSNSVGVGSRVIMTDDDGEKLIDLIIGKRVKDAPGQRYVRRSNQDLVYVVELDPSKLSTDFSDWIEDDLLHLSAFDLRKLFVDDYSASLSIVMTAQGPAARKIKMPRHEMTLVRADESAPWELTDLKKFDPVTKDMVADSVADDEEAAQDAVQGLVDGLDDLLIVDIAKKPAGLSADLKAGDAFLTDNEAVADLVDKGFIFGRLDSGEDMLSSEGEVVCTLENGVEYVLRFGKLTEQTDDEAAGDNAAGKTSEDEGDADESAGASEADEAVAKDDQGAADQGVKDTEGGEAEKSDDSENLRRYLFVMARFNEDAVKRPELRELPALPDEESDDDAAESPADENAEDDATAADESASDETDDATEEAGDENVEEAKPDRDAILAQREAIAMENEAAEKNYEILVKSGQAEVKKLNDRFGDWYYVISNDVYKKIHLGREQVVKKKEQTKEGDEAAAGFDLPAGLPDLSGAANEDDSAP